MFNTRGSLREVPSMMVDELKAQGWKIVVNAKREYAPELDQENPNTKINNRDLIDEDLEAERFLKFIDV